jgi:hypothetical protein
MKSPNWFEHIHIEYQLLTKQADSCISKFIKVPRGYDDVFIDSLEKCGYSKKVKYLDKSKDYKVRIDLVSFTFERIKNASDSLFKYTYKTTLTNLKTNTQKTIYSERLNTSKEKTLKAYYPIQDISEIKGTSIIKVLIYSEGTYALDKTLFIFSPSMTFYY